MMTSDREPARPVRKTYAQLEAELNAYVGAANTALASTRDKLVRWSSYQPSHGTFEMLVGEPDAEDNVVLCMPACDSVAGPVRWQPQRLEVSWRSDPPTIDGTLQFEIRDEGVGFRAVGGMFRWRQGYDLWAQDGLWFGRGDGPPVALTCEQAEDALVKLIRHYYNGLLGYGDLLSEVTLLLDRVPVVSARPRQPR
jgi:hypothetical protein